MEVLFFISTRPIVTTGYARQGTALGLTKNKLMLSSDNSSENSNFLVDKQNESSNKTLITRDLNNEEIQNSSLPCSAKLPVNDKYRKRCDNNIIKYGTKNSHQIRATDDHENEAA